MENQVDTSLNSIIFDPFEITYSKKGRAIYNQDKYYDIYGNRHYESHIAYYEYYPKSTNKIDHYKLRKIKKLFSDFFYIKSIFKNLHRECAELIFAFALERGNNTVLSNIICSLKNIIRLERIPKRI